MEWQGGEFRLELRWNGAINDKRHNVYTLAGDDGLPFNGDFDAAGYLINGNYKRISEC